MIRLLFIFTILTGVFISNSELHAQEKGMIVSPKRVVFDANERVKELTIANRGSGTQKYRISIVNRKMGENGGLQPATAPAPGEFFADRVLRFGPRQVELGPKQTQRIRIMSRLQGSAADGEYRSHLLIQEIPEASSASGVNGNNSSELGINVQSVFGISVPIFLRKGDLTADVSLSNAKIVKDEEGETYVNVAVNATGSKSVFGTAKVFDGSREIALLKGVAVYLSTPKRLINIPIPDQYAKSIRGKTLKVTFGAQEELEDAPDAEVSFKAP